MYKKDGFEFLLKVFNDSGYLEEISGLKELKKEFDENELELILELSDTEWLCQQIKLILFIHI